MDDFELEEDTAKVVNLKGTPLSELQGDMVISLGGDGTLLYILSKVSKPIFGINCGGVGFLTEMEQTEDIFTAIKNLEKGEFLNQKLQRIDTYINEHHVGSALMRSYYTHLVLPRYRDSRFILMATWSTVSEAMA